jgi:hypothetical protein
MGSIAMDGSGDIAVGYSESSSTIYPAIYYTGRVPTDALGTLEAENLIYAGAGSQSGQNLNRWGDYSAMSVDPTDDCTFWYTNEYLPNTGAFNWNTRIASFKFNSCGQTATKDFSIGATPSSQSIVQGSSGDYTVTVSALNGYTGNVTLSASGLPAGASAGFSTNPIHNSGSSTMTVTLDAATAAGSYPITITGSDGTLSHSTQVTLVVASSNDFTISATPASNTVTRGSSTSFTVSVGTATGFSGGVSLSVSLPPRTSATFSSNPVGVPGSSTLTITAMSSGPRGTYQLTITGTSGGLSHSTNVNVTIQ